MTETLLGNLSPVERLELKVAVARAYLAGKPVNEFMVEHADCSMPRWLIQKLYRKCFEVDGDKAPRCRHCPDKHVGHKGVCRVARPAPPEPPPLPDQYVSTACPCCGNELGRETLAIDINSNRMAYRGQHWKLQPQVAVFMQTVAQAWPKPADAASLQFALWGAADGPRCADTTLKTYASKLRGLLAGTGVELHTGNRPGSYLLWLPEGQSVHAACTEPSPKNNSAIAA